MTMRVLKFSIVNAVLNLLDSSAMFRNTKVVIQNYRENLFTDISTADTN